MRRTALVLAIALLAGGCYHAIVDTGLPATGPTISKPWANSFVYGLVPPPPIDASTTCTNGVAKVETQHSFLNGLVAGLTFGIYTPITITVRCAGPRTGHAPVLRDSDIARGLATAADLAVRTGVPVYLELR